MAAATREAGEVREAGAPSGSTAGVPRLHLASRSPRRTKLLSEHGLEHDAEHPGVDDAELVRGGVGPVAWVAALAYFKAAAAIHNMKVRGGAGGGRDRLVVGADTICVQDGELFGQPKDGADAERMLRRFENAEHDVLTGVALVHTETGVRDLFVSDAKVRVGRIGDERIGEYVKSGEWRGKAGAYNLHERLEAGWPIEFTGDPTTIVGLPMKALVRRLERFGVGTGAGRAA